MTAWSDSYGLWGLFLSAFVSATLAPGGSEAVLAYFASKQQFAESVLLSVATVGNTLGAMTTWVVGYLIASRYAPERALDPKRAKAVERMRRWGTPLLLLSWLPLVGDGFCFAAGSLRLPFWGSLLAIAAGKVLRYEAIVLAFR